MIAELTHEQLAAAMDRLAMDVLAEAGVVRAPVDAFALARALGVTVALDGLQSGRARYVRLRGQRARPPKATILLRPDPRPERQQWAVAHEIGEHVVHRLFAELAIDPREAAPNAREVLANHLAGRILLPGPWFAVDGPRYGWDLPKLKRRYGTASHELIARRMLECAPPMILSIFDHGRLWLRRSNLPGRVPPLSAVERQCWQMVHQDNRPRRIDDGPRRIQGWPVHEPGWRREILRTELDEFPVDL